MTSKIYLNNSCESFCYVKDNFAKMYVQPERLHFLFAFCVRHFAKAFDKVPHRRLLHKLDYYGIRGSTHKWINSWLSGRTQQVFLDGQASDPVPVLSGVPQGSVVGPILLFIYYKRLTG